MIGHVTTADEVCGAAEDTLRAWLPQMLAAIAEQQGIPPANLRTPRSWEQLPAPPTLRDLPTDQLPGLFVSSPGLAAAPTIDGDGDYSALWTVSVFVADRGASFRETQQLVRAHAAAVRTVLTQQPTLGGRVNGTSWVGEDYARLGEPGARTIGACVVDVAVRVSRSHNIYAVPAGLPPADLGDTTAEGTAVTSTAVDVTRI